MLMYFFSSTRLSCVQNLVTRQHFLLYIYEHFKIFSCDLSFDISIVPIVNQGIFQSID